MLAACAPPPFLLATRTHNAHPCHQVIAELDSQFGIDIRTLGLKKEVKGWLSKVM